MQPMLLLCSGLLVPGWTGCAQLATTLQFASIVVHIAI
jgi:hypothetical protein